MKKVICTILCLVLLTGLAIPALATEDVFVFTADSEFAVGSTATVDAMQTRQNIMSLSSVTSEQYNAVLEGNVEYIWYRDGLSWGYDISYTFMEADAGYEFYCAVFLFEDAEHTKQCGIYKSQKFTVSGGDALIPEITTEKIPDGKVGEEYYCKLNCSDPDVVFELYQSSLPEGMYITQHGEIEGTPTKAGFYHINVIATPEFGEDYATMKSFEFTIEEPGPQYTIEIMQLPNKITYTAGEKLDMTGLRVRIWTPEGYIDSKDGDKLTYSKKALVTLGEQKIKLSYEDAMEIFIVTVVAVPETATTEATEAATTPQVSTEVATTPEVSTEAVGEEVTEATEAVTEDTTVDATEKTEPSDLTVGATPTEEIPEILDGPGSEGPSNPDGAWIIWLVVAICVALLVGAVVIILIVVKRKKAS